MTALTRFQWIGDLQCLDRSVRKKQMPMARTSTSAKKAPAKKSAAKKSAAKKSTAKKSAAKKSAAKKAAKQGGTKAAAKRPGAKKSSTKKSATRTAAKSAAKKTKKKPARAAKSGAKSATKAASKKSTKKAVSPKVKLPAFLTDKKWLKQQHEALLSERATYTHNAEALAAEAAALMADRDPGDVQFDEESGEGDTLAVERDRDLALSAKAREKVDEIDAALARLERGMYGQCVSGESGDIIPKDRLEALPMAAKCVKHQTAMF